MYYFCNALLPTLPIIAYLSLNQRHVANL